MHANTNASNIKENKPINSANFPAIYLTTISIIQGVAFAILIYNTFGYVNSLGGNCVRFLPYTFMSFIAIILVTFENMRTIDFFKWPFNLRDVIIPFVVGFSEITPMFYLNVPKNYWIWSAIFLCSAAWSFNNSRYNCKQHKNLIFGENNKAYNRTIQSLLWNVRMLLFMGVICILAWKMSSLKWYLEAMFIISILFCAGYMARKDERFMKGLRGVKI